MVGAMTHLSEAIFTCSPGTSSWPDTSTAEGSTSRTTQKGRTAVSPGGDDNMAVDQAASIIQRNGYLQFNNHSKEACTARKAAVSFRLLH
jgi:hypothetical protein